MPWLPSTPDYSRRATSPRRGYAAIREGSVETSSSAAGRGNGNDNGSTTSGGAASSSVTSTSQSRLVYDHYSTESSPMLSTHQYSKKSSLDSVVEQEYMERYLRDLEQQKEDLMRGDGGGGDGIGRENGKRNAKTSTSSSTRPLWYCTDISRLSSTVEVFLANMPLTIGAVGLSWVTLGVVWFKWMEENNPRACTPVHYFAPTCQFPEFPGCFACDTDDLYYRLAVTWHYACHTLAGTCCALFLLKLAFAGPLVAEELRNPATSTPMGVVCITMVCVFAGRFGMLGQAVVILTSLLHVCLAFWFLYQAIVVYRLYPDPGWFPNTVGLSYAAVKTWLYFPVVGHVLLVLCVLFFVNLYGITLFRVARNEKIALPVCFIQLSAPSITLYGITLWAQSFPVQETILQADPARLANFVHLHRAYYLPVQHVMMALSLVGMLSILHATVVRWNTFSTKEFSPAHIALVFPILSHTNAVQAYRSGIDAYSTIPSGSWFKICLYVYWMVCLVGGSILCLCFTYHYVIRLPKWTNLSDDDDESLADDDEVSVDPTWIGNYYKDTDDQISLPSALTDAWNSGADMAGWELLDDLQDAVNPAVLVANETGVMVRVRRGTADFERFGPYKRTRRVPSMGFDPILTQQELETERTRHQMQHQNQNQPHRRTNSMSLPMSIATRRRQHQRSRTLA